MTETAVVRGRFAPSPTGALHFGSLLAAVASFLDARSRGGEWLVRMEDLDPPREVPGAASEILRALESLGLEWDGAIVYQSRRHERYAAALEALVARGLAYPCACTRREIADSALHGIDGPVYPGTCREGLPEGRSARAWRARVSDIRIELDDELQGVVAQQLAREVGDFVLRRADGLFAYQLAVVVDDAEQAVTRVVRGADLIDSTQRQMLLQAMLGYRTPAYLHIPVAVNAAGEKLSKQTLARALDLRSPAAALFAALQFLGQSPPQTLRAAGVAELLAWAKAHWQPRAIARRRFAPAPADFI